MAVVLALTAVPSAALAERWQRPVPGDVARPFSYARAAPFARGAHRGVDLAAPPGTPVRAACGGTVVHAGPVAGRGSVVSVRCGRRRVSHLPLATVSVRAGAAIRPGAAIGTVAPGHGGLHIGVRREGDPFAYEDPVRLLPGEPVRPPVTIVRAPRPAVRVRPRAPRVAPRPAVRVRPRAPRVAPQPGAPSRPDAGRPGAHGHRPAPWPVFAGLALLLAGATGSGTVAVRRRARRHAPPALAPAKAAP